MELKDSFNVDVYCCNVEVVITDDIEKFVDELDETYGDCSNLHDSEGFVYSHSSSHYYVVFDNNYISLNTIGHEIFHLTCMIAGDRDVLEEEAKCWLNGYLHSIIHRIVKDNKIELKDE